LYQRLLPKIKHKYLASRPHHLLTKVLISNNPLDTDILIVSNIVFITIPHKDWINPFPLMAIFRPFAWLNQHHHHLFYIFNNSRRIGSPALNLCAPLCSFVYAWNKYTDETGSKDNQLDNSTDSHSFSCGIAEMKLKQIPFRTVNYVYTTYRTAQWEPEQEQGRERPKMYECRM
jgi:hypothetical protein